MEFTPPFNHWLKERRKALDLTQGALAERVGYALVTMRKVEAGVLRPSRDLAERLADALGVPSNNTATFVGFARGLAPSRHASSVPEPPTTFVGREAEVALALTMLARPDVRLVTLCGPPGVGKTRLAQRVANRAAEHFEDGVCAVWLATAPDAGHVLSFLMQALQVQLNHGPATSMAAITAHLRDRSVLLLFDNFEHVLDAAVWLDDLLAASPRLKIIVTSRQPLHLAAEHVIDVKPLPIPHDDDAVTASAALDYPAVALYVERAGAANARFILTDANAGEVVEICRRLDGIPLALELAAAHARHYTSRTLLSKLPPATEAGLNDGRLDMLARGPVDAPARQSTMRATIGWSYDLLNDAEKYWFRRMGVFVNGCEPEQLALMEPGVSSVAATEIMFDLADRGLVQIEDDEDAVRASMLILVREFALEQLAACGELEQVCRAHAEAYLALARQAWPHWIGPHVRTWLHRFQRERGNLGAALRWCESAAGDGALGLEMAGQLLHFWLAFEPLVGLDHLDRLLVRAPPDVPPTVRARALLLAGALKNGISQVDRGRAELLQAEALYRDLDNERELGITLLCLAASDFLQYPPDLAAAQQHAQAAREIAQRSGDRALNAMAIHQLGNIAIYADDPKQGEVYYLESLALAREMGDDKAHVGALLQLCVTDMQQLNFQVQRERANQALDLARAMEDWTNESLALWRRGEASRYLGDLDAAERDFEHSRAIYARYGDWTNEAFVMLLLSKVARDRGEWSRAEALCRDALTARRRCHPDDVIPFVIEVLGAAASGHGQFDRAARLFGAAAAMRARHGYKVWPDNIMENDHVLAGIRAHLSDEEFGRAWAEGERMSQDEAIAHALS